MPIPYDVIQKEKKSNQKSSTLVFVILWLNRTKISRNTDSGFIEYKKG